MTQSKYLYNCHWCERDLPEDKMESIEANKIYNKCWSCWNKEQQEREDAMATLD